MFAIRLPRQVDSAVRPAGAGAGGPVHGGADGPELAGRTGPPRPAGAGTGRDGRPGLSQRLLAWAGRGFDHHLITALHGESVLRLLSGMLTIYLAFYIESTAHGLDAAVQMGAIIVGAGVGNFLGNATGTRLKLARPEMVITISTVVAAVTCLLVAIAFDIAFAVIGMLVATTVNALSKIALDALIQRDVDEAVRSSAFARSETFLQLAWVLGAAIGVALPSDRDTGGALGFWVSGGILSAVAVLVTLRHRALARSDRARAAAG